MGVVGKLLKSATKTKKATTTAQDKVKKEARAKDKAKRTSKKGTQGTGFRFATRKSTSEEAAGRINARTGGDDRFAYEQEYGRGGKEKITQGSKSFPRMDEAASKGSRNRAKVKVEAERKAREGDEKAAAKVKRMDKASAEADKARARKSAATRSAEARKDMGISLAGVDGRIRVGAKQRLKDNDIMVGNTTNGVTKDGEIIGNPTDNQIATVVRNLEARSQLSAEAKSNLAKLKRMSQRDKQDRALNRMERRMYDTGPDRKAKGGMPKKYNKGGYANCGASMKPTQKSTNMAYGGMARKK